MHHPIHPITEQILIFILGAATLHGLYLSVLLFLRKERNLSNLLLAISVFSISLYLTNYLLFLTGIIFSFPHGLSVLSPAIYLVGPSFYFFVQTSLRPFFRWRIRHLIHLVPFIYNCLRSVRILQIDAQTKLVYIGQIMDPKEFDFSVWDFLMGTYISILLLGYIFAAWNQCKKIASQIEEKGNQAKALWLKRFCLGFSIVITGDFLIKIFGFSTEIPAFTMEYLVAALIAISIHIAGYFAIEKLPQVNIPIKKYQSSGLDKRQISVYQKKLIDILKNEKPWLQSDLKIANLAEILDIPSHQLSQVLSEGMKTRFSDLINQYRIEEIKRRLIHPDYQHFSILGIAFDCGFNTKATFNRVFRKIVGMTPSQYAKEMNKI